MLGKWKGIHTLTVTLCDSVVVVLRDSDSVVVVLRDSDSVVFASAVECAKSAILWLDEPKSNFCFLVIEASGSLLFR